MTTEPTLTTSTTETSETKTTEEKTEEPKAPEGPPEKYEFKAPEGYELDAKLVETASATFKELGLTQAQADKLVELYNKQAVEASSVTMKKAEDMVNGWRNETLKDTTLSDGTDLKPEVKAVIGRAIDSMGPKLAGEFRAAMALTGGGVHPAILRGIHAISQQATEGRPVKGANPSPAGQAKPGTGPINPARALFPNLPSSSGA